MNEIPNHQDSILMFLLHMYIYFFLPSEATDKNVQACSAQLESCWSQNDF